jgi:hypothetical protein
MRWKETEKKETNEVVMADRGRGMEWYVGLTVFDSVALCVPALGEFQCEMCAIR